MLDISVRVGLTALLPRLHQAILAMDCVYQVTTVCQEPPYR
jgi:hypothetical protein